MFFERPPDRVIAGSISNLEVHNRLFKQLQRPPLAALGSKPNQALGIARVFRFKPASLAGATE
jgi:hypothetical protein